MSNPKPPRPAAPAPAVEVKPETAPEAVNETASVVTPPVTEPEPEVTTEGEPSAPVAEPERAPEEVLPSGLGLTSTTTVETKRGIVIETNNAVEGSAGWPVVASTRTKVGGTVVETFVGTRPDTPWAGKPKPGADE